MAWVSEYTVTFIVEAQRQEDFPKALSNALVEGLPKEWFSYNDEDFDDWRVDSIWQATRRTYPKWRQP